MVPCRILDLHGKDNTPFSITSEELVPSIFFFSKNFQKSGHFAVPPPKDRQCLLRPNREGTHEVGFDRHEWLGNKSRGLSVEVLGETL